MTDENSHTHDHAKSGTDTRDGPIPVPRQVHCELRTLKQMGMHDLLSNEVLGVLETYNFEATRQWALDHPDEYVQAVRRGTRDRTLVEPPRENA